MTYRVPSWGVGRVVNAADFGWLQQLRHVSLSLLDQVQILGPSMNSTCLFHDFFLNLGFPHAFSAVTTEPVTDTRPRLEYHRHMWT